MIWPQLWHGPPHDEHDCGSYWQSLSPSRRGTSQSPKKPKASSDSSDTRIVTTSDMPSPHWHWLPVEFATMW